MCTKCGEYHDDGDAPLTGACEECGHELSRHEEYRSASSYYTPGEYTLTCAECGEECVTEEFA